MPLPSNIERCRNEQKQAIEFLRSGGNPRAAWMWHDDWLAEEVLCLGDPSGNDHASQLSEEPCESPS